MLDKLTHLIFTDSTKRWTALTVLCNLVRLNLIAIPEDTLDAIVRGSSEWSSSEVIEVVYLLRACNHPSLRNYMLSLTRHRGLWADLLIARLLNQWDLEDEQTPVDQALSDFA